MSKQPRKPGNRGQRRGFTPEQLATLRNILVQRGDIRGLAMLCVGVDSMLRSSDLRALKVGTIRNATTFTVGMRKEGGRSVTCTLTPKAQEAVAALLASTAKQDDDYLFTAHDAPHGTPLCEQSLQGIVKGWARRLGLDASEYSSHSIRRSKAAIIYSRTKDVAHIQVLLGHRWITSTQAYLGASTSEALELARSHDV